MFRVQGLAKPAAWLAVGIVFTAGCASSSAQTIRAGLGENFELRVGQSAIVDAVALEVSFEGVSTDSRCAKGETCVWEGDAIVRLWLERRGGSRQSVELHTASKGPGNVTFDGYGISLIHLDPIPVSGRTISPSEYVVTLEITAGGEAMSRS
jgi:hypothetical protein